VRPILHVAVLACSLLVVLGPVAAQAAGRLEGRLTRPDGSPLTGVTVVVDPPGAAVITDVQGRYAFDALPPGSVNVTFILGTRSLVVDNVTIGESLVTLDQVLDWNAGYAETVTVYGASRRPERLFEAPVSVSLVPETVIMRESPPGQLPKLLQSIPGVELAQSGVFDFNVNIRGINSTLSRRVLTLVDGRDPASVLVGAQEWAAFGASLDEVSRIEVVHGANSALYGANAFNGVVDITTKEPRYAPGGSAELTAGEIGTVRAAARHSGAIDSRTYYRVNGGYGRTNDFYTARLETVEYPGLPLEILAPARDDTSFASAGARVDRYLPSGSLLTVEGGWSRSEGNMFLTGVGRSQNLGADRPWLRSSFKATRWRATGYYDGRYGRTVSLASSATTFDASLRAHVEAERLFNYSSGRGRFVLGGSARYERADTRDDQGLSTILRGVEHAQQEAVVGQLSHQLSDRVKLALAARVDDSTLYEPELSARAGLVYAVSPTHGLRFTYNRAFDTGSFVQYFTRGAAAPPVSLAPLETALAPVLGGVPLHFDNVPVLALGNEALGVERVQSFEGGYSGVFARQVIVRGNYYYNRISNLLTPLLPQVGTDLGRINPAYGPYQPPPALGAAQQALVLASLQAAVPPNILPFMSNDLDGSPIFAVASFTNFARVNVQGAELSVQYFRSDRFAADVGYSALSFTPKENVSEEVISANAPAHSITLGATSTYGRLSASFRYRWADQFTWSGGAFHGRVPALHIVDAGANVKVGARTMLLVNAANLFDNSHYEIFGGDLLRRRALVSIRQEW
jgi:outer membrane receptor protein involved in Fe transport